MSRRDLLIIALKLSCVTIAVASSSNLSIWAQNFGWTPPILETEASILKEVLEKAGHIRHAHVQYFETTLEETVRAYFMRINCISNEESTMDFEMLHDVMGTIHGLNKKIGGSSQNYSLYLSLVPGVENIPVYHENFGHIDAVASAFGGVISHVLLDLSSVDVGPLDGFNLVQKLAVCNEVANTHKFECGFIFDLQLCIEKISVFSHIRASKSTPVFLNLNNETYEDIIASYERVEFDTCIYSIIHSGMKFAGTLDNENKFRINSTHFEIENVSPNRFRVLQAQRISKMSFQNVQMTSICHTERRKSYSKLSSNMSTSAVISISSLDLHKILLQDVQVQDRGNYQSNSFTELFHRFLVKFPSIRNKEDTANDKYNKTPIQFLFEALLRHSVFHKETYHLRPLQLWIAFTPEGNIRDEMQIVMDNINFINSILPGTVVSVFLDYNELRIDSSSIISVVKTDIEICNSQVKARGLSCGFVFLGRNCQRSTSWLAQLPIQVDSIVLIRGQTYDLKKCSPGVHPAVIGMLENTPSKYLKIDFSSNSVTIPPLVLEVAQGGSELYIPMATSPSSANDTTSELSSYASSWLHSPIALSRRAIVFAVEMKDLGEKDLLALVTAHSNVVIRLNISSEKQVNSQNDLISLCTSNSKYQIAILMHYHPKWAKSMNSLNDLLSDIAAANVYCGNVFTEILIEWDPCFFEEACPSSEARDYYDTSHFAGLANITRYIERIKETPLKTGLIISHRTVRFLFDAYFLRANLTSRFLGEEVQARALRVSSLFNISEVLSMLDQFDTFIYEPELTLAEILINGVVQAATNAIKDLQVVPKLLDKDDPNISFLKSREQLSRVKLRVVGCHVLNTTSWNDFLEYARFWEIMSNWADKMDVTLIMDVAYQSAGPDKCKRSNVYSIECACGWWTRDVTSRQFLDRKSYGLMLMNKLSNKKPFNKDHSSHHLTTISIVASIVMFLILLASLSVPLACQFYRKMYVLSRQEVTEILSEFPSNEDPVLDMTSKELIGKGSSKTSIYKCVLKTGNAQLTVATKTLKSAPGESLRTEHLLALRGLISEAKILRNLKVHKNVIKYIGLCTAKLGRGELQVVLEYCPNGSLLNFLPSLLNSNDGHDYTNVGDYLSTKGTTKTAETDSMLQKWCFEIANGLEYLVSENIVHADIAARNILLDEQMCCKICDFGLSRRMERYKIYVKLGEEPLPWRWMAPESLGKLLFNEKTDVWMYGVTIWEIYTLGQIPFGRIDME